MNNKPLPRLCSNPLLFAAFLLETCFSVPTWAVDLIWADLVTDQILRAPAIAGGTVDPLYERSDLPGAPENVSLWGLAVGGRTIYVAELIPESQVLRGASDGSGPISVVVDATQPRGLAVNGEFVYWAEWAQDRIMRANNDGTGTARVLYNKSDYPFATTIISPWGVAVDEQYLYWTDQNLGMILRAPIDGSGPVSELFIEDDYPGTIGGSGPRDIEVHEDYIYWTDISTDSILSGKSDGSGLVSEVFGINDYPGAPSSVGPRSISLAGEFIYWTDGTTDQILMGAADGSGEVTVLYDAGDYPGAPESISPNFIAVIPSDSEGDFDYDGDVDGSDFLAWQRGESPNQFGITDLAAWQANYGAVGSLSGTTNVPEPSSLLLIVVGYLAGSQALFTGMCQT